ncbi:hypothetical protein C8R41DRAFT_367119 [Lentinula lateritia]|uniref:Lipoyl-binding domain-containing protein n=1 Tax=Lentinula lateritia TaxID=40482 RepID=A0ABQ8VJZ8_9AGAR|nr:hypothetical protein C8R41DRAFT_367119 [Lentinula lateritia]
MTEGTITRWLKKEGEAFSAGDVLLQIESDNYATLDVQAEMAGVLGKILIPDGTSNVPVEKVLAVVTRDAQELTRLRPPPPRLRPIPPPLSRLDVPPTPVRMSCSPYPEIPTPISATSFYQLPSPALPESPTSTPALRRPSLHHHHPLSNASRLELSQRLCESESTVGCEASYSRVVDTQVEVAGLDLRRKILASFSKGPGESNGALEYLNGIL